MDMRLDDGAGDRREPPPLVVLWDLDGTLVDSEPLHARALDETLAFFGAATTGGVHEDALGRDVRAEYDIAVARHRLDVPFEVWIARKYEAYFAQIGELRPREGAPELYRALDAAGAWQAVVSNSDRMVVSANLRAVGLEAPGRVTVSRNDVRDGKPAPEPYHRAAFLLGGRAADTVVVEDSPTGAAAGLAAGFRTLYWPQDDLAGPAGAERVDSLAALTDRLFALAGRPALSGRR